MAFLKKKKALDLSKAPEEETVAITENMENVPVINEEEMEKQETFDETGVAYEEEATEQSEKDEGAEVAISKNKKKNKEGKNGKKDEVEVIEKKDYVLYMITDKPINGVIKYFDNFGVKVSKVFSNIQDARDVLLMQIHPSKVIVVDTGTGRFTNMSARKDLIDLMGISDDENLTTVFYSDSVIKTEVEYNSEVEDKQIDWYKYKSTAHVLAYLLQCSSTENYVLDGETADIVDISEDLTFKGITLTTYEKSNIGNVQINTSDIVAKQQVESDEYELMDEYLIEV